MALLFRELILTITLAFICSLLVGLTVVAMLSARLLQIPMSSGFSRFPLSASSAGSSIWFTGCIATSCGPCSSSGGWSSSSPWPSARAGYTLVDKLGNELLPQVDDGRISVDIRFSPGGTLDYTKKVTREIHDMLRARPRRRQGVRHCGGASFREEFLALRLPGENRRDAQRDVSVFGYLKKLRPRLARMTYPDARIYAFKSRVRGLRTSNTRHNKSFSLGVRGEDLPTLNRHRRRGRGEAYRVWGGFTTCR